MAITIRKAERRKAKLRLAIIGPTGSGKTFSALQLAFGLGSKTGMIDTENGSGDLYGNIGDYDIITLDAPYTVQRYLDAIRAFEEDGYDTIVIDSLTHAWSGGGGLLDKSAQIEKSGRVKNSFAAWREITPEHNKLVEEMLGSPCHIIGTMRVKMEYVLEMNEKGKQVPRKVGLAPVQRDGLEYEFTLVFDIDSNHVASASKDRTSMFDGWSDKISPETGRKLLAWLNVGTAEPKRETPPAPPPEPEHETPVEMFRRLSNRNWPDPTEWLKLVETFADECNTIQEMYDLRKCDSIVQAEKNAPRDVKQFLIGVWRKTVDRLSPKVDDPASDPPAEEPTKVETDEANPEMDFVPKEPDIEARVKAALASINTLDGLRTWALGPIKEERRALEKADPKLYARLKAMVDIRTVELQDARIKGAA